jgi:hypothetical protein
VGGHVADGVDGRLDEASVLQQPTCKRHRAPTLPDLPHVEAVRPGSGNLPRLTSICSAILMWARSRHHASTSSRVISAALVIATPTRVRPDAPAARWRLPVRLPEQHGRGSFDSGRSGLIVYIRTIRLLIHAMQKAMAQSVCGDANDGIGADPGPCPKGLRTAVKKLLS